MKHNLKHNLARPHRLFWGSSYDRGLDILLFMWPEIKKQYPDAELHITYGWDLFDKAASGNPERMKWKESVSRMMEYDGIKHYGRVGKTELRRIRRNCGIWAYPTYFTEINCITALDCQKDGVVPVVCNFKDKNRYTALDEVVQSGIKIEGNITDEAVQDEFKKELLALMGDYPRWKHLSHEGKKFSRRFEWPTIAEKWSHIFAGILPNPLVSIITPTIRKGFWNIMAHNIAEQTHQNIEWIVVDDYPKNRKQVMELYVSGLTHKYVRGLKSDKYFFSLSTANNIGWRNSNGELLVYLQDFILMPKNGIEMLVDIYRHQPNALIAPTDRFYYPKYEPDVDSEDWFNGKTDVVGEYIKSNIRNQYLGMRLTENPSDFEMNYGAIPRKILDHLGGWYDFFNDGLGYDNTEIALRALMAGYKIIIDDTNQAVGLDHWEPLKEKQNELGEKRTTRLNDLRYIWLKYQLESGKLTPVRNEKLNQRRLEFELPEEMSITESRKYMDKVSDKYFKIWDTYV